MAIFATKKEKIVGAGFSGDLLVDTVF